MFSYQEPSSVRGGSSGVSFGGGGGSGGLPPRHQAGRRSEPSDFVKAVAVRYYDGLEAPADDVDGVNAGMGETRSLDEGSLSFGQGTGTQRSIIAFGDSFNPLHQSLDGRSKPTIPALLLDEFPLDVVRAVSSSA